MADKLIFPLPLCVHETLRFNPSKKVVGYAGRFIRSSTRTVILRSYCSNPAPRDGRHRPFDFPLDQFAQFLQLRGVKLFTMMLVHGQFRVSQTPDQDVAEFRAKLIATAAHNLVLSQVAVEIHDVFFKKFYVIEKPLAGKLRFTESASPLQQILRFIEQYLPELSEYRKNVLQSKLRLSELPNGQTAAWQRSQKKSVKGWLRW